jgi:hypothetical protein
MQTLNNNYQYFGQQWLNTPLVTYAREENCVGCHRHQVTISRSRTSTLEELIQHLKSDPALQLNNPSLITAEGRLYFPKPPQLQQTLAPNLTKTLPELGVTEQHEVVVLDDTMPTSAHLSVYIKFTD